MYIPLDYWELLLQSDSIRGPKGGLAISYDNAGRHINNTLFIELVQSGWIGSSGLTTQNLTTMIHESLESKRSVMLAARHTVDAGCEVPDDDVQYDDFPSDDSQSADFFIQDLSKDDLPS